jgi:hypothetical protein
MRIACFVVLLVLAPLEQALAWGQEGHSIIAEIAQRRLDPDTLRKINALLGGEVSLASIASWADDYRALHRETAGWHFVDIPFDQSVYDPKRDCNPDKGDCVIHAIARFQAAVSDCSKPLSDRSEALKFLVHFVGDVHQPLHVETRFGADGKDDRGGNDVPVTFFGQKTNLHALWDLYMPRLKSREVLAQAIRTGAASKDFFGTAYGQTDRKFEGFALGSTSVVFDDTLLLIEPDAARAYEEANRPKPESAVSGQTVTKPAAKPEYPFPENVPVGGAPEPEGTPSTPAKAKSFFGAADIPTATAKMRLVQIADEIVSVLASDPNAHIHLTVEISADFPDGASDTVKRAISENARSLGLKTADWE